MRVLVTGAGGFIGGHLVRRLLDEGHDVDAADQKYGTEWYQRFTGDAVAQMGNLDLSNLDVCRQIIGDGVDEVYSLAADMGGIGYLHGYPLKCQLSVLISTNMLVAAADAGVGRFFYSSSACVYNESKQADPDVTALREEDAYPAMPEQGYGWEKLYSEQTAQLFAEHGGLETRIARYHNVYGIHGTWDGGREKAPAAICRKVAQAAISGVHEIEIWGDGEATRSFMHVDDCIEGTLRIMRSDCRGPLNLGSDRLISITDLVSLVEDIAGVKLKRTYNLEAPEGVRGRNSDNTRLKQVTGWEPGISLEDGMERLYRWIYDHVKARG